jgi:uncharacterized membrane protein YkoI
MIEALRLSFMRLSLLSVLSAAVVSQAALAPALADKGSDGVHGSGHDEEDDHDAARGAVRRGEAMPLADVLVRVGPDLPGEIVEVEFEREHGRWIYEFKVIDTAGRLHEIYVDAATGRIVSAEID